MEQLDIFIERLRKIGIEVEVGANFPWIYLEQVNGNEVEEIYESKHNFTMAFLPVNIKRKFHFTDIKKIFEIIRKYR